MSSVFKKIKYFSVFSEEIIDENTMSVIASEMLHLPKEAKQDKLVFLDGYAIKYDSYTIRTFIVGSPKKTGQPFIDLLIYNGNLDFAEAQTKIPDYLIEITKNDYGDSGNQCYQRIEKFVYAKRFWGTHFDSIKKYMFYNVYIRNTANSIPGQISEQMLRNLGVNTIKHFVQDGEIVKEDTGKVDLEEFIKLVNSTKKFSSENRKNNRVVCSDNVYEITTNLTHSKKKKEKSPLNDPNVGYVCGLIETIASLNENAQFVLTSECNMYNNQITNNSKLWSCLQKYKSQMTIYDKDSKKVDREWTYEFGDIYFDKPTGEKMSSMYIHSYFDTKKGFEILFHNHAGCERSSINVHGEYYNSSPCDIPDIVVCDYEKKQVLIIEAKINDKKKIQSGLKQLEKSRVWFNDNVVKKKLGGIDWETFEVLDFICVIGKKEHPTYLDNKLILSIKNNTELLLNSNVF
jgi:hypothetical protein